jgi:hypothetical protein
MSERPYKDLLGQVLCALRVPHFAVQKAYDCRICGLVKLFQLVRHALSTDRTGGPPG